MLITIAFIVCLTLIKWLVYTGLLWLMIKLQKLQYNALGLFGSSALATLLNFVPVVGCYLSWVALLLCLWKVTRASIVPDVVFTVAIAGAIMFVLNLWAFTALITLAGHYSPGLRTACARDYDAPALKERVDEEPRLGAGLAQSLAKAREVFQKVQARAATMTNSAVETPTGASTAIHPSAPPQPISVSGIALKGVVLGANPSAMIESGGKVYTVEQGETVSIPSGKTILKLRCDAIESSAVSCTLNDTQKVLLQSD